ncbi:DUF202 domain-containing protein [Streptomyces sp. NPDC046759]|uniref:YidH family protein n=1 Tax=Streptomyces sp. NPDC046759 TaxID=3155019 RepID=UPI0033F920C4
MDDRRTTPCGQGAPYSRPPVAGQRAPRSRPPVAGQRAPRSRPPVAGQRATGRELPHTGRPSCTGARLLARAVSDERTDPDPRFTYACERTFLACSRTALALVAAGPGRHSAPAAPPRDLLGRRTIGVPLIVLGAGVAVISYVESNRSRRALRAGRPWLPGWRSSKAHTPSNNTASPAANPLARP